MSTKFLYTCSKYFLQLLMDKTITSHSKLSPTTNKRALIVPHSAYYVSKLQSDEFNKHVLDWPCFNKNSVKEHISEFTFLYSNELVAYVVHHIFLITYCDLYTSSLCAFSVI